MSDRQRLTPPQTTMPELVDLFCRVISGDGGVGPVGCPQGPGEDDLARGVQDVGEGVVGGFIRNLLTRVPKSAQTLVATLVRSIFAQPDHEAVWTQHGRIVEQLQERFSRLPNYSPRQARMCWLSPSLERMPPVVRHGCFRVYYRRGDGASALSLLAALEHACQPLS